MNEPAVAIGYLERFAADFERESGNISLPEIAPANGIKIAVVGSGPAGLSFAGDMVKKGYDVYVLCACLYLGIDPGKKAEYRCQNEYLKRLPAVHLCATAAW